MRNQKVYDVANAHHLALISTSIADFFRVVLPSHLNIASNSVS